MKATNFNTTKTFKSFNNYLGLLTEYEQKTISGLIAYRAIPLEPGLMKRLGYYLENQEAYHLTNSVYLEQMIKNQNKRNVHISTFTKGGPELARFQSQPNVLLKLRGDSVIEGDSDIWSVVSIRGRRWLDIKDRQTNGNTKKLTNYITGVIQSTADALHMNIDVYKMTPEELMKAIDAQPKHILLRLYKVYLEKLENMLNKEYKLLNEYLRNAAEMQYNEVILDKWKIIEIWSIEWDRQDVINFAKKHKIKYSGVIHSKEFTDLIIG